MRTYPFAYENEYCWRITSKLENFNFIITEIIWSQWLFILGFAFKFLLINSSRGWDAKVEETLKDVSPKGSVEMAKNTTSTYEIEYYIILCHFLK